MFPKIRVPYGPFLGRYNQDNNALRYMRELLLLNAPSLFSKKKQNSGFKFQVGCDGQGECPSELLWLNAPIFFLKHIIRALNFR